MNRLNITAKIWLSIGVFVAGFVLATALGQIQGRSTENTLRATSDALFPAAQKSQEAEGAFQRVVKGLGDAVVVQDASGLDRAAEDGRAVLQSLQAIAAIPDLSKVRSEEAGNLAGTAEKYLTGAMATYGTMLKDPSAMTPEMQGRMRDLASTSDSIKSGLQALKEGCSGDLRQQLADLQHSSTSARWLALAVFGVTILVSAVIVNLTIRRSIMGPIVRVIHGVQKAADESAATSDRMAQSGQGVARDAQEQAACVQETSASLEEISATSRQNASRATEADTLMKAARQTVDRAANSMDHLTKSMDAISKSSNQVAVVLKSIDEIAFHTNILALNAAVEAARAGEAGAGFSVVADEVRSLAHRAADAARQSAEMVEKTITDVSQGVKLVSEAHRAFSEVSSTIATGGQVVSQIAASSIEQARGVEHIGQAIARIEAVTQNNAANAQQTAENADAMISQVETTRNHLAELVTVVGLKAA
jgi:methyl-accepting chemotaxis protein